MTAAATTSTKTLLSAGARYYGALTLPLYDWAVLKTVVPYAWQCPLAKEQDLYNRSVGPRHLDVGVASGYFLKHTQWPTSNNSHGKDAPQEIVLMDLNPNSTKYAADRLRRMHYPVSEVVGDALDWKSYPKVTDDRKFDSVGLFHLLHCIPGNLKEKKVVLENAGKVIHPDGVVFGANVTPVVDEDNDTQPNLFAQAVLAVSHSTGALNNQKDSHKDMETILDETFYDYKLERVGCMSLWEGRHPK